MIRVLSCALRLAEALDRSHLMLVQDVACEKLTKPDRVRMTLLASADAQLELWAAEGQAPAFEKTFGLPLEVRVAAGSYREHGRSGTGANVFGGGDGV